MLSLCSQHKDQRVFLLFPSGFSVVYDALEYKYIYRMNIIEYNGFSKCIHRGIHKAYSVMQSVLSMNFTSPYSTISSVLQWSGENWVNQVKGTSQT